MRIPKYTLVLSLDQLDNLIGRYSAVTTFWNWIEMTFYKRLTAQDLPESLEYKEGTLNNSRNQSLFYRTVFPEESSIRAIAVFVHGVGDHSGRYFRLFERLSTCGYGVAAYDMIGHGKSADDESGIRAHARDFQYFVDDTNFFIQALKTDILPSYGFNESNLPLIYIGMSYGTLVGLHTILSGVHTFHAAVLVAPAVCVEWTTVLRVQAVFASALSILIPRKRIVPAVRHECLTRDKSLIEDMNKDPLMMMGKLTSRMGEQSLSAMRRLKKDKSIEDAQSTLGKLPVLSMIGSDDLVVSVSSIQDFHNRFRGKNKELKVFEGMYHCLFEEVEAERVYAYLVEWLGKQI
uniref:Serine protease family S33 putative n=1 Tax=Albugo laibachii Nc14 TaxID=890382 RepID=F0WHP7_9STRA|nr:serine protease family S33 putative [Albugo laibachii Nc14]CCA23722.1 serine protease family S33 putative [Albugo laibachii Nc14]|eukprot:CCA23722.1 serine protease family S33 putative [Albugo laibachii Nc14]